MLPKIERNKKLVKLRQKKWTWGQIAKEFNISRPRALEIYREQTAVDKTPNKVLDTPNT